VRSGCRRCLLRWTCRRAWCQDRGDCRDRADHGCGHKTGASGASWTSHSPYPLW